MLDISITAAFNLFKQIHTVRAEPKQILQFEGETPEFNTEVLKEIIIQGGAEDNEVFVIAVTGVKRCGKSFLINLLETYFDYYRQVYKNSSTFLSFILRKLNQNSLLL